MTYDLPLNEFIDFPLGMLLKHVQCTCNAYTILKLHNLAMMNMKSMTKLA